MRRSTTGLIAGLTLLLAVATTTSGCRQGSFLGHRYNNFRAYYNTFYNARQAFEDGEEQLIRLDVEVDRSRFLSVFADVPAEAATPSAGTTSGPFQNAIEKSADLLRERPDSKWADDALLLIGRSYFYQRNLVGAEAKFRETVAAAEAREQEALMDEARYWLGRTLGAQERYDEAGPVLEEALAREGLSRYWRARLQLALAEQYVQQRAWEEAATALQAGLADLRDADLAGRASFLLGQVLEAKGDYAAAADAYAAVESHRPYYELLYAAQLSRALVLGIDAGRHEEALALVRRMRRDDKNFQKRAEVELAYARLLAAVGRHGEARERYEALLYDTDAFSGTTIPRSEVHYYYGALYRDQLDDYVRAAAYLDTAATGLRTDPGREALVTHAALTGVRREADAFLEYAGIATELSEADSLLDLGALDDEALAVRRTEIEAARLQAWEEEQRRLAALRARQGFQGGGVATAPGQDPYRDTGTAPTPGLADAGFLGYRDVARLQDALVAFQSVWGDRPLVPNWRRRQAIGGAVVDDEMDVVGAQGAVPQGRSPGGPPPLDWANVPRTPERRAILLTERASLRYELGNVLFLSLARPDSAAHWYGRVVEEDADAPVAPRALYAMAEVRREQGRTAEAEALYRRLLEVAPESALAATAREQLGLPPREADDATEAAGLAAAAYDDAYAQWRRGAYADALGGFLDVAGAYGETEQAPRALLAAAEVFADWVVQQDTLALEDGIPAALVPPALRDSLAAAAEEVGPIPAALPDGASPEPEEGDGGPIKLLQNQAEPDAEEPLLEEEPDTEVPDPEQPLLEEPDAEEPDVEAAEAEPVPVGPPGMEDLAPVQAAEPVELPAGEPPVTPDSTAAPVSVADTTDAAPNPRLVDLLVLVEAQYPGTPYAEQARARRLALFDQEEEPADAEASEGAPVVGLPAAPPDAGFPAEMVEGLPPETFGLEGRAPLSAQIGGYAWRLTSVADPAEAATLLRTYLGLGLRAVAVQETGEDYAGFALLVGQFPSVAAASATRDALPEVDSAVPPRVVSLSGLRFLRDSDLSRLVVTPGEGDFD